MRRNIKHTRQCFIGSPNTSKFVKNTPLRVVFSTLFSVFGYPDETLSLAFDILLLYYVLPILKKQVQDMYLCLFHPGRARVALLLLLLFKKLRAPVGRTCTMGRVYANPLRITCVCCLCFTYCASNFACLLVVLRLVSLAH